MGKDLVTNIQKFSVHDGPGIRSVVFFKGCPLSCKWCSNPENINSDPELMYHPTKCIGCGFCVDQCEFGANTVVDDQILFDASKCIDCGRCAAKCCTLAREMKGRAYTVDELVKELDKDIPFYQNSGGGITYSGGEPLLHPEMILALSSGYKAQGINSAVETCGFVPWSNIEKILSVIDLFLFDVKFIDGEKHKQYCGKSNELILDNLKKLCEKKQKVIVRIPIIPGVNDTEADLDLAGGFLQTIRSDIEYVNCLPYHNYGVSKYDALGIRYELQEIKAPEAERMEEIKKHFEAYGLCVKIGG